MNFRIVSVLLILTATSCVAMAYQQHDRIQDRKALHHYKGIITAVKNTCKDSSDCSPWAECNNTKCVCKNVLQKLQTVHCEENLQLSVIRCHCVTYDNMTNVLVEGYCIENCENDYKTSEYLPLPKDVSQLNQFMCEKKWNRTGRLCGRCLPGHSPLAYSYDMRCVKCPEGNRNIWKYILVAFGPLTVFYFVVVFFKISATSSHLHGFVNYCQLLATPAMARLITEYINRYEHSVKYSLNLILNLHSIWNLDFFRGLYLDICLDVSPLTVLALDYAVAIYPLLLTVVSYILIELHARNFRLVVILWRPFRYLFSRIRRNWESRTSVIDGFATFFLLSFTKMVSVSVDLLTPVKAVDISGGNLTTWVLYYDATMEYFGKEHLPFAILALVCSTMFAILPILFLLIYQFRWFQRLLSCLHICHPLLREVMESFQSCYTNGTQPGTKDHRWFSAVFYILRYINVLVYSSTIDSSYYIFGLVIIFFIIILLLLVQPYKDMNHIKIDVLFIGLLGMFLSLNLGTSFYSLRPKTVYRASLILRAIVLVIPLLIISCFSIHWILSRLRKGTMCITRIRAWRQGYASIERGFETSLPDRLVNPQRYEERNRPLEPICSEETYNNVRNI